ncbi:MAG TPA: isochorismatase family cysteine hydrolase [Puia sp.]|jgi:nicotinamidase-related amidase|nr:isochorismatase family cysteine hydrolase [Puia sp.]
MGTNSQTLATALLIMDVQEGTVGRVSDSAALLSALGQAVKAARAAQIPVIYVVVGFRKGIPEISEVTTNKSFGALKAAGWPGIEEPIQVDPAVAPQPGEMVVTKRRVSAFAGSDLEVILRGHKIEHLVLAGIATSGVVLSTVREAADKDYRLTVLSDGCADMDPEVHGVLLNKVFPRQSDVLTVAEWAAGLGK